MGAVAAFRSLISWCRAHPAYFSSVATSYGQVVVGMVIQLALVPWYLEHLDTFRFGVLMMLLSFVNFAAFGIGWVSGGMQRLFSEAYVGGEEARFECIYTVSRWVFVGYAALLALVGIVAVDYLAESVFDATAPDRKKTVVDGILGLATYMVVLYAFSVDRVALAARGRAAAANLLFILSQVVAALLIVPMLLVGGDLLHVMLCFAAGSLASLIICRRLWLRTGMRFSWLAELGADHIEILRRLTGRLALGYFWIGLMTLALQADVLILGSLAGPDVAARFVLIWRLAELAVVALWRMPEALQPFITHLDVRQDGAGFDRSYRMMLAIMTWAGLAAGVVYAVFGQALVSFWVGADKAPDDPLAYVLAGGAIFWLCLARTPVVFGYAAVRLRTLSILLTGELVVKLLLVSLLLRVAGYYAPLIAINAGHIAVLAIAYQMFGRRLVVRLKPVTPADQMTSLRPQLRHSPRRRCNESRDR